MRPSIYNTAKPEVVRDIYGESYDVAEIKAAPKHGIEIYYGRPVSVGSRVGGCSIVLTPELARFVKDTLNQPRADFELPFTLTYLSTLRRRVQNNPFKTYQKWLEAPSRPPYIVFANAMEDPEYVRDYLDRKFVLYSAQMTDLGIPVLRGVDEDTYLSAKRPRPGYILTEELANLLGEYRKQPHKELLKYLPITNITLIKLRRRLGFDHFTERNTWYASRIDDLIRMTPTEFKNKHTTQDFVVICTVGAWVRRVLAMRESGSAEDARMIALLENNWSEAGKATRTAIDEHYGDAPSISIRRAYKILKMANKI